MNTTTARLVALIASVRASLAGGYEAAPATTMVAVYCSCCARPLVDAKSVETGVGPECRKRHGYATAETEADWVTAIGEVAAAAAVNARVNELLATVCDLAEKGDAHKAANLVVHRIALYLTGDDVGHLCAAVRALGYAKLAARIAERLGAVVVTTEGDKLLVKAPYSERFVQAMWGSFGRTWDRDRKVNVVPAAQARVLWGVLRGAVEPGTLVVGSKGIQVLRPAAQA